MIENGAIDRSGEIGIADAGDPDNRDGRDDPLPQRIDLATVAAEQKHPAVPFGAVAKKIDQTAGLACPR